MTALRDRTVLVTGGAGGLGAAICEAVAAQGAVAIVADVNAFAAQALARRLIESGGRAEALPLNVGSEPQVATAVAEVRARYGRLDVLVNNAAVDVTVPLDQLQTADWERVLRTNLHGAFLMAKHAAPCLREVGGQIVNIASTASKRAWPNACAYHASKWGLLGLSHALHAELRGDGVRVTAVVAGGMRTPFLLDRFPDIDLGTLQDPANVARTVVFVLTLPRESAIPEVMVLPMRETSWP